MADIIVVVPYLPYPKRAHGLSVRLAPVIDELTRHRSVHLVVVGDRDALKSEGLIEAQSKCRTVTIVEHPFGSLRTRVGLVKSIMLAPTPPKSLLYAPTNDTCRVVSRLIRDFECSSMLVLGDLLSHFALLMTQRFPKLHYSLDWVDSPSLHADRVASRYQSAHATTVSQISGWEQMVNASVRNAIYISAIDAQYANGTNRSNIHIIPNELIDDFPSDRQSDWRAFLSNKPVVTLGFLGNMGYAPNEAAATRLLSAILPQLKRSIPEYDVRVRIIGRNPSSHLLSHAGPSVGLTGFVSDIWSEIESVDLFVFPMTNGAGMQNKVLEAMRGMRPIVASGLCIDGLPDAHLASVFRADSTEEFVSAISGIVENLGAARESVVANLAYLRRLKSNGFLKSYLALLG